MVRTHKKMGDSDCSSEHSVYGVMETQINGSFNTDTEKSRN